MKIKNLLLLAAAASLSATAFADDLATGELAWQANGDPAMIGQTTNDHIFTRNEYSDMGDVQAYDNTLSFKAGTPQLVWFWLDDDQVYETQWIKDLTPDTYNTAGDAYNEITYSSFQFDLYVPQSLKMIITEDDEGNEVSYVGGPRLPLSGIILSWGKQAEPKVIDGITYDVYTVVQSNSTNGFKHFSAKNANLYKKNGALKKNDGALVGFYFQNDNQENVEGRIADMIIANQEFGIAECRDQDTNHQRFLYGTGGNNETQRFQLYNRVAVWGSTSVVENLGQKTVNSVKYYNIAGMESDAPFSGVNIQVTTYNDGTTSTCKVIK
jgi:hypothetical protein